LTGLEAIDVEGLDDIGVGRSRIVLRIGSTDTIETTLRIDSEQELTYLRNGGILPYVIRKNVGAA
jgi:aconitate hydratase